MIENNVTSPSNFFSPISGDDPLSLRPRQTEACATLKRRIKQSFTVSAHMSKPQPVKLQKEPLIEAVCQLRVAVKVPLNAFFPGLLLAKHPEDVTEIQQLPTAMLPEQVRAMQPEMAFAALVQLKFKNVLVMIGERSITVSNPLPYLGWARFKALILEVFSALFQSKLVPWVERYSLKYTNVLRVNETPDSILSLDWKLSVGRLSLNTQATTLRTETINDDLVTIITLSGGVTVQANEQAAMQGSMIDIDTICQIRPQSSEDFAEVMLSELDRIRRVNKEAFFECLTDEAIHALGPIYQ
jgi:uncharacterized protein (TIGR04255 family)